LAVSLREWPKVQFHQFLILSRCAQGRIADAAIAQMFGFPCRLMAGSCRLRFGPSGYELQRPFTDVVLTLMDVPQIYVGSRFALATAF